MTSNKTEVTAKKIATNKTPTIAKKAANPVVKPAAKKVKATSKSIAKKLKKETKVKTVRDSFSMPQVEYQKIAEIKEACLKAGLHVKKSEVLRAGLKALVEMKSAQLEHTIARLKNIKSGQPKKS